MRRGSGVLLILVMVWVIGPAIQLTPLTSEMMYERPCLVADDSGPSFTRFQPPFGSSFYRDYSSYTSVDVSDEDGLDQVWCSYKLENDTEWMNVSMGQINVGITYTCSVIGYLEEGYTTFHIQFHANDTNGMSSTSRLYTPKVYYTLSTTTTPSTSTTSNTPSTSSTSNTTNTSSSPFPSLIPLQTIAVVGMTVIVATVVIVWWLRKTR